MDYRQTLDFLYRSLPVFQDVGGSAYKAGLDRIVALEEASGVPHRRFRSGMWPGPTARAPCRI